jgi:hypothetical protein
MFKLLKGKNSNTTVSYYLTIHRGWWLKWVATEPTKNGHFIIHTLEGTEHSNTSTFNHQNQINETARSQSSYLTVGGSFWLQHKWWSKFSVGVASEGSATFGGRMLGLYRAKDGGGSGGKDGTLVTLVTSAASGVATTPFLAAPTMPTTPVTPAASDVATTPFPAAPTMPTGTAEDDRSPFSPVDFA